MIAHFFNRFSVVTKFILLKMDDLKPSSTDYYGECRYLENLDDDNNEENKTCIKDLVTYCIKLRPYMAFLQNAN